VVYTYFESLKFGGNSLVFKRCFYEIYWLARSHKLVPRVWRHYKKDLLLVFLIYLFRYSMSTSWATWQQTNSKPIFQPCTLGVCTVEPQDHKPWVLGWSHIQNCMRAPTRQVPTWVLRICFKFSWYHVWRTRKIIRSDGGFVTTS
jgi:hypothetical protein